MRRRARGKMLPVSLVCNCRSRDHIGGIGIVPAKMSSRVDLRLHVRR